VFPARFFCINGEALWLGTNCDKGLGGVPFLIVVLCHSQHLIMYTFICEEGVMSWQMDGASIMSLMCMCIQGLSHNVFLCALSFGYMTWEGVHY
jgi:hypothetical protein